MVTVPLTVIELANVCATLVDIDEFPLMSRLPSTLVSESRPANEMSVEFA